MSAISVNLEGFYSVKVIDPKGNETQHVQKNLVLRSGLGYLLAGTCVRNLYLGHGIMLPDVDESYRMTVIHEVTATSYQVALLEDTEGKPYYQHQWKFNIPAGQAITDISELATGYTVSDGEAIERRFFSRTILQDEELKLKTVQKREIDSMEITYTLHIQYEQVSNNAITKMIGTRETTFAIGQHELLDLDIISLNQPLADGKFFQGYAVDAESNFKPFAFIDDNIVNINVDQITSVNVGSNQYVSATIRIEDIEIVGRIAIYNRLGIIQYRLTPGLTLFPGGHIELKINFTLGNK